MIKQPFLAAASLAAFLGLAACAHAQTSMNIITGQVWSAAQWNAWSASKQDYNVNGIPVVAGGTGRNTLTARAVLLGNGTSPVGLATSPGAEPFPFLLASDAAGTAPPSFQSLVSVAGHFIPLMDGSNIWSGPQTFGIGGLGSNEGVIITPTGSPGFTIHTGNLNMTWGNGAPDAPRAGDMWMLQNGLFWNGEDPVSGTRVYGPYIPLQTGAAVPTSGDCVAWHPNGSIVQTEINDSTLPCTPGTSGHAIAVMDQSNTWSAPQVFPTLGGNGGFGSTSGATTVTGTGGGAFIRCQTGGALNCQDLAGEISILTGTGGISTTGTILTINFQATHAQIPVCTVTAQIPSTGQVTTIYSSASTSGLVIGTSALLSLATHYDINYTCIGN